MVSDFNGLLAFPNRIGAATLSGGSWEPALPLDNLKNRFLAHVARSTDAMRDSTQFDIDLGTPRAVRVVGLVNHNLSLGAQWRIRSYDTDSPANMLFDSGWMYAWLITSLSWDIGTLEWEAENYWYGGYTAEEIEGITPLSIFVIPQLPKIAQVWTIEIDDENNADNYVDIGRVFIGPAVQPEINFARGAGLGLETDTQVDKSLDGVEFFETREALRFAQFDWDALSIVEGFGSVFELVRRAGVDKEVIWIPDPTDEGNALRRWFMGRLRVLPSLSQPYNDTISTRVEIKETR